VTLKTFSTKQELLDQIAEDKANSLHPLFVLYDWNYNDKTRYLSETAEIGELCKSDQIWFHVNLGHNGCFAFLEEYKYLGEDPTDVIDSLAVEASKYMQTSFESSLLWAKNRTRIYEGMHWWEYECEKKFNYLNDKNTYTVDFKNYTIYLGKTNKAYKFWFVINMMGIQGVEDMLRKRANEVFA